MEKMEDTRKIVRKRIAIFYIVGLSLCFSDIAYRYISWQIKKADLVQVGNTGLWITPLAMHESKIRVKTKQIQDYEKSIVFLKKQKIELEEQLLLSATESAKDLLKINQYDLEKTELALVEEKKELKLLKKEEV